MDEETKPQRACKCENNLEVAKYRNTFVFTLSAPRLCCICPSRNLWSWCYAKNLLHQLSSDFILRREKQPDRASYNVA